MHVLQLLIEISCVGQCLFFFALGVQVSLHTCSGILFGVLMVSFSIKFLKARLETSLMFFIKSRKLITFNRVLKHCANSFFS